jgi:hypothetical protein
MHHSSGGGEQMFGAKQQVPHGGQSDKEAGCTALTTVHFRTMEKKKMTKLLVAAAAIVLAVPSIANATCGTRGGPGFRGSDGKCKSWEQVERDCGPDGSRCQREQKSPYFKQLPNVPAQKLMQCAHGLRNDC